MHSTFYASADDKHVSCIAVLYDQLTIGNGRVHASIVLILFPPIFFNFILTKEELTKRVCLNIIANHKNYDWLKEEFWNCYSKNKYFDY